MTDAPFEIFLACPPGLEPLLREEAAEAGFVAPLAVAGGVTVQGEWSEVWRANLHLRGAARVLARVAEFRAPHLAQLDKRARRVDWAGLIAPGTPVRVEATCRRSKIYHDRAAAQRIARAVADAVGPLEEGAEPLRLAARIEDDLCTISLDTSGAPLHQRGTKQAVGKAPLRETLAALFLRACFYRGSEPVVDPMCGSGTIVLEAAAIAAGLAPGRARGFAFERLATFDAAGWGAMREAAPPPKPDLRLYGYDRDQGAIRAAEANAGRAGVAELTAFACQPISALERLAGPPGLVLVNPPYGGRIGNARLLHALYGTLGEVLRARFAGWRVGVITSEPGLARATGLPFAETGPPVPHGALKIRLYRTSALP